MYAHNNRRIHNQHFLLLIFKLNSNFGTLSKISTHKQYLFGPLFPENAKKTYADQSTLQVVLLGPVLGIRFYLKLISIRKMLVTNKNKVMCYFYDNVRGSFMTSSNIYDKVFM